MSHGRLNDFTLEIDADLDTVEYLQEITFVRMQSDAEETSSQSSIVGILGVVFGVLVVIALLVVFVRVIMGTQQIEDEVVSLADYQSSLENKYREIAPAPEIMSAPTMAPVKESFSAPPASVETIQTPTPEVSAPSGPPLPEGGLPDGWTMEQWQHYGQQWLDQKGL